jgi:hypothetical protein
MFLDLDLDLELQFKMALRQVHKIKHTLNDPKQFETVAGDVCVARGNYTTGEYAVTRHLVLAQPE